MSDYSACAVTASYNLSCLSSVGGLRKVYIFTDVTGVTETTGEISAINGSGSAYTYELRKKRWFFFNRDYQQFIREWYSILSARFSYGIPQAGYSYQKSD